MSNKVQEFLNERFGEVRANIENGVILFVASDVAKVLNYATTQKVTDRISSYNKGYRRLVTLGGEQKLVVINEIGLHEVLSSTRNITLKDKKEIFKWLTNKEFESILSKSCKEKEFLSKLEESLKPFLIEGILHYKTINYVLDYYIPMLNIVIEYDEDNHRTYTYEEQELRQTLIEKELNCRFIRISDKKSDEYNIGMVIKELFQIK